MFHCETCRSQMLEYLYDLLEGDERQAFEAHLKDCASLPVRTGTSQGATAASGIRRENGIRRRAFHGSLPESRVQSPESRAETTERRVKSAEALFMALRSRL